MIDLHVHSDFSDGSQSPEWLVDYAKNNGITAFALTDHDNVGGVAKAIDAGEKAGVEIIPGVEVSSCLDDTYEVAAHADRDVHILGFYVDCDNPEFQAEIKRQRLSRETRNRSICELLQKDGFDISYEMLVKANPHKVPTRGSIASLMVERGYVGDVKEAFAKYLNVGCKYYVERDKITPIEAVHVVLRAGGIPVLAHPFQYPISFKELRRLISTLKGEGLVGMECYYSLYDQVDTQVLLTLADEYGLIVSGGSDFHGKSKIGLSMGTGYADNPLCIPESVLDNIRAACMR